MFFETTLKPFEFFVSYDKKTPLRVTCVLTNTNDVDLYVGPHDSIFDIIHTEWTISNDTGVARYNGEKVERIDMFESSEYWKLVKAKESKRIDLNLIYGLPGGGEEFEVKYNVKKYYVLRSKDEKPSRSKKVAVDLVTTYNIQ